MIPVRQQVLHCCKFKSKSINDREIAVVFNQAGDEEEPEQVLHNRTVACYRDMRIRRNRTHQEKADRDEQQQIGIHRRSTRAERRTLHRHVPQDVRKCSKHQALIPHGRHKRRQIAGIRHPADSGIERQIHRQTNEQQAAHADEPAGSADQAAACDTLNRPPDGKADAVDQAVCHNSAQFFDKPAQRCQNPRIDAVRRGTYRCRAEFIPQTAEHRAWVRLPDTVKESRDSALVVPCAQTHQQPHEQTVFK